ncbi:MAG TPA: 3-methyl-2-oxobutanoate dehydrogenase subunit VorB [Candidatus Oscillibacter excrementigallinarum]|uniref:3-methyl-2-oxobutanoate dehydrogenase subunit VorB n=1 Tax=Candidatus Oscillibacter excrementigallinarum TaxID=2838716 RepID=A0A9D2LHT0_9FIRM|nr:3-methyl-2-oxobutanoate dehydrogenase subunit VorB [Candidatus Oscillibacter excrementigallinarum]
MGKEILIQGNAAIAESAIRAGCKYYFGYPITPSSEIAEYYAERNHQNDIVYVQAETELAAFNMVAGVASVGKLGMTATSGPGFCLGVDAISFMASAGLPGVVVDCMRPGPGDGEILAAQGDYFQLTKGGGHGDYRTIVLAPYSVQELADYTVKAFNLAIKYRNPVILVSDGMLSKLYENAVLPEPQDTPEVPDWALRGAKGDDHRTIVTCGYGPEQWERHCMDLQSKYREIQTQEQRWESCMIEDADHIAVAYGSLARVTLDMVKAAREQGLKVGMIRPITLWPFPEKAFAGLDKHFFVTELSAGQMVEDVKLAVKNKDRVSFYGRMGGNVPTTEELLNQFYAAIQ